MSARDDRPIGILICALGGEGGGVLTRWVVEAARAAGLPAQSTSIPGVAQRTGSTTYYVEVFPNAQATSALRQPVLSLYPVPGAIDVLLSSELLETARQIGAGMASRERTTILSSSSRTLTTHERMQMGDGRLDQDALLALVADYSCAHHVFDMNALARANGTVVSAILLGALAASGLLPVERSGFEAVIARSERGARASLAGFAAAYALVAHASDHDGVAQAAGAGPVLDCSETLDSATLAGIAALPAPAQAMATLGAARVAEYQDRAYAALYLARLARVARSEAAGAATTPSFAATCACARYLALWMAFDDVVRVAQLKARRSRRERVAREVRSEAGELLRIDDYFKPGVPEFAGLLPRPLAALLTRLARRRALAGQEPWALPLKLNRTSVGGMLALRSMAGLRRVRRFGSRYAQEQHLIERWLEAVEAGLREHAGLGEEIALCGRLIKGYGATYERGRDNLLHIVDHLATARVLGDAPARAAAVRSARAAALSDEAGTAFDRSLVAHGAAPRPVKEVPIRLVRRQRSEAVSSAARAP